MYVFSARNALDRDVVSADGVTLGILKDVVINPVHHQIVYAIIAVDQYLGLREEYYAIPWQVIEVNGIDNSLTAKLEAKILENMAGISDVTLLPGLDDVDWHKGIFERLGLSPKWLA